MSCISATLSPAPCSHSFASRLSNVLVPAPPSATAQSAAAPLGAPID